MIELIAMLLLALQPALAEPVEDRCDLIWCEHFYCGSGSLVFIQHIFVDEVEVVPGNVLQWEVVAWRLVRQLDQIVVRDYHRGGYYVLFQDGEVLRLIRASAFRESHSQTDSEIAAREKLPQEYRRGLTPSYVDKKAQSDKMTGRRGVNLFGPWAPGRTNTLAKPFPGFTPGTYRVDVRRGYQATAVGGTLVKSGVFTIP